MTLVNNCVTGCIKLFQQPSGFLIRRTIGTDVGGIRPTSVTIIVINSCGMTSYMRLSRYSPEVDRHSASSFGRSPHLARSSGSPRRKPRQFVSKQSQSQTKVIHLCFKSINHCIKTIETLLLNSQPARTTDVVKHPRNGSLITVLHKL